jgi:predicted MFS family arabinose efflux permease
VLAASMLFFAAGNIVTALSSTLPLLLASRFLSGLMHGVVMALAASTAVAAAGTGRSGNAVATVFAGLTIALMVGVPLGTFAGGYLPWQYIFLAIAAIGIVSAIALLVFAPKITLAAPESGAKPTVWGTISDYKTLYSAAITVLSYTGSFTGFTYISVLLERHTQLAASGVTMMFVLYGVAATVGNTLGGKFMDKVGSRNATLVIVAGLIIAMAGAYAGADSIAAMAVVMALWGLASFGAVPVLHTAVLLVANHNPAGSVDIASGMNIAAFNLGITIGSAIGGYASVHSAQMPMLVGLAPLAIAAAMASRLPTRSVAPAALAPL